MIEVNPAEILSLAKIKDYFIDYKKNTVYLTKAGLQQVAAFFDEKLYLNVSGIERYGWLYKNQNSPD